jgi:HD-GYP domain-containing protein (c-di-GMP phosphodiesterase class II)
MIEIVATQGLRLGMFIADLDRPWLGTPFLLQGFLLDSEQDLASLRELCRFVTVDRERSTGGEYCADPKRRFQPEQRQAGPSPLIIYPNSRRLAIPTLTVGAVRELAGRRFPAVHYQEDTHVEEELPRARTSFEKTQDLLRDIGEQVAIGKLPDIEHVENTVDGLVECVVRNPDSLLWLAKLKQTDNLTYDHTLNTTVHLMAFGRHLGLSPDDLHVLGLGGLLKDVGYINLPSQLIQKPAGLTRDERDHMRRHVELGRQILADQTGIPGMAWEIILKHHERIDGSGYPARLRGPEVGLFAETAGLADAYCAMAFPRPFRQARNGQWIIEEINGMRDHRFTASVVDEFIQFVGLYPVGTLVELNSGEVGVVVEQNRVRRLKPRVMVLLGPDKSRNNSAGILNLLNDPLIGDGVPYRIVRILPPGAHGLDPREFYL